MGILRDFQSKARQSGAPVTVALVILLIVGYVTSWLLQRDVFHDLQFALVEGKLFTPVWSFVTYPFYSLGTGQDFIWFVISLLWLWSMGGSVERDLGKWRFLGLWVVATILGAISIWLGCATLNIVVFILGGPLLPVSVITVVWGTRNASALVMLMLVLPITGRWLAWLTVGIVLFSIGSVKPALGVFALIPLALAYLFAANKIGFLPFSGGGRRSYKHQDKLPVGRDDKYFDEVKKREKERAERERLRKLFETSLKDDEEKR
jgi:membrane associated rhomboid family serine protease